MAAILLLFVGCAVAGEFNGSIFKTNPSRALDSSKEFVEMTGRWSRGEFVSIPSETAAIRDDTHRCSGEGNPAKRACGPRNKRDASDAGGAGRRTSARFEEKQKETASLAFVFDTTYSMNDDLVRMRKGAKSVLNAFLDQEVLPVSNYILVPFNDPDIERITITDNPEEFVKALDDLSVHGGGDCPEMACNGILTALQNAHPNSYLFVFSDASAKDYELYDQILGIIQRKHSQVNFFLSGLCSDRNLSPHASNVYYNIASASSGQVFMVTKGDITAVMNFVQQTLHARDVTIFSVNRPTQITGKPHEEYFNVTVEKGLKELIMTLTGYQPTIAVLNPLKEIVEDLKTILNLPNVVVVSVNEPEPVGTWSIRVTIQPKGYAVSDTIPDGFTLRIRGGGVTYDILQGFSIQKPYSLQETAKRPLQGTVNYILVEITPLEKTSENIAWLNKYKWTSVDILKLDGQFYESHPLEYIPSEEHGESQGIIYVAGPFSIPFGLFTLSYNGFDGDGNHVTRVSRNAISSQPAAPALITMIPQLIGFSGKNLIIHCHIESLLPFVVDWYKNEKLFQGDLHYVQSTDAHLLINNAQKEDEAIYTCQATNSQGSVNSSQGTNVTIIEPPEITKMVASLTKIVENHTIVLDCEVRSDVNYTLKWTYKHEGKIVELLKAHTNNRFQLLMNNSLQISSILRNESGLYCCSAENVAGSTTNELEVVVHFPPEIVISPADEFYFTNGDNFTIECTVLGKPGVSISWEFNEGSIQEFCLSSNKFSKVISIPQATNKSEGRYSCVGENEVGKAHKEVKAIYWVPPITKPMTNLHMTLKNGLEAMFNCSVYGMPKPTVRWLHNNQQLESNQKYMISSDGMSLKIFDINEEDEGFYTCEATSIQDSKSNTDFELHMDAVEQKMIPNDSTNFVVPSAALSPGIFAMFIVALNVISLLISVLTYVWIQ